MAIKILQTITQKLNAYTATAPIPSEERARLQHYVIFLLIGVPNMLFFGLYSLYKGDIGLAVMVLSTAICFLMGLKLLRTSAIGIWIYRFNSLLYVTLLA